MDLYVDQPATISVRCDQNRIFGCGRVNRLPATYNPIGASALSMLALGPCSCGLPLARVQALYPPKAF